MPDKHFKTGEIKDMLRARYGGIASGTAASCCAPAKPFAEAQAREMGYSVEDLAAVPDGANLGLGRGDPSLTAAADRQSVGTSTATPKATIMSAAIDLKRPTSFPGLTADPIGLVRDIAPLLHAEAPKTEALRQLTPAVVDALHAHGLYRTLLPKSLNGFGIGLQTFVKVMEAMAAADASTAWCVGQASGCSMAAVYVEPEIAREIWGDDSRGVLAWGFQLEGRAKVVLGGYRVSGKWAFGSGGHHATWMGAHCHVELPDGSMLKDARGNLVERTMLLRQDQIAWSSTWDVVGLRGTGSDTYTVNDLFVADAYTVRRDIGEERRIDDPFFQFTTTSAYSSGFAGVSMGIARGMLDALKALAQDKKPSHTARTLRDSPVMHHLVAENEAALRSARAFVLETIAEGEDSIRRTGALSMENKVLMRLATTTAIQRAKKVAEFAYHEAGATAIFTSNAFERKMRDIHASAQQVQGRTGHIENCGQYFLGLNPTARFI